MPQTENPGVQVWTPISVPGTSERSPDCGAAPGKPAAQGGRSRGFTLIELLVVVVIVAVVAATVSLTLAPESDTRALRRDGERLALLLEAAVLEAAVSGRTMGWSHGDHGYRFWSRDPARGWIGLEGDALFRPRGFDGRIAVARVEADGRPLEAGQRLVFRPAGAGDFIVELRLGAAALGLRGDPTGRVGVEDAGTVALK